MILVIFCGRVSRCLQYVLSSLAASRLKIWLFEWHCAKAPPGTLRHEGEILLLCREKQFSLAISEMRD